MKFRLAAAVAGVAILGAAAIALAQTYPPAQVSVINPTDLIQVIPLGNPGVGNQYASPARLVSQRGYYKSTPLTAFNFTFGNAIEEAAFTPSGTLSTGFIYLSAAPSDGQKNCFFSTNAVTTLTVYANTGQTINNAVTTLGANGRNCYLYSASNLTWDRDQ